MNFKDQLTEKKQALAELEPMLKAEDVSAEVIAQGEELVKDIEELEQKIAKAEKAAEVLNSIGNAETNNNNDITEEKTMSTMEEFTTKCAEMVDKKAGASMSFKTYTDVVTAPQIAEVDRSVAPQPRRTAAADFFSNSTISGNAITYFLQGAFETNSGI